MQIGIIDIFLNLHHSPRADHIRFATPPYSSTIFDSNVNTTLKTLLLQYTVGQSARNRSSVFQIADNR